jgi:predicted DNA-binding protein YlxM (UPF0122 family)
MKNSNKIFFFVAFGLSVALAAALLGYFLFKDKIFPYCKQELSASITTQIVMKSSILNSSPYPELIITAKEVRNPLGQIYIHTLDVPTSFNITGKSEAECKDQFTLESEGETLLISRNYYSYDAGETFHAIDNGTVLKISENLEGVLKKHFEDEYGAKEISLEYDTNTRNCRIVKKQIHCTLNVLATYTDKLGEYRQLKQNMTLLVQNRKSVAVYKEGLTIHE